MVEVGRVGGEGEEARDQNPRPNICSVFFMKSAIRSEMARAMFAAWRGGAWRGGAHANKGAEDDQACIEAMSPTVRPARPAADLAGHRGSRAAIRRGGGRRSRPPEQTAGAG